MPNKLEKMKKGKYVSVFLLMSMTFTYLSSFRLYINENIYKAFDLANIGPIGKKLTVSVILAVLLVLGWILGTITARFKAKKIKNHTTLYWLSALFALVALLFTPFNLQLLMPSSILQNIAMVLCITHLVFALVDSWLFSFSLCVACKDLCLAANKSGMIYGIVSAILATALAFLSVALKWSFPICIVIYTSLLWLLNMLHNLAFKEAEYTASAFSKKSWGLWGIVSAFACLTLIGGYFITESLIALV